MNQNHGFIPSKIEPDHYIHGDHKLGDAPVIQDGQWDLWLPIAEDQNLSGLEPMCCTTMAITNVVETLITQKFGEIDVYSKRFLAYISGTTQYGNDPHTVAEALREKGDVNESDYPYTTLIDTWVKFYAIPAQALYAKALLFLSKFNYGHSWVTNTSQASLMAALNFSPLSAAVFAWYQDPATGYYIAPAGTEPSHYVMIYGYDRNNYWKIWDSYAKEAKKLAWDFPFIQVKRHTITKNSAVQALPWWQKILDQAKAILESFKATLQIGEYSHERTLGAARSPQWPQTRAKHIEANPTCAVCGGTDGLNAHHILPFHNHPQLELDPNNLITLCTKNKTINCHERLGHLGNFATKWNPNIRAESLEWYRRFSAKTEEEAFPVIK